MFTLCWLKTSKTKRIILVRKKSSSEQYLGRYEALNNGGDAGPLRQWHHGFEYCSECGYVPLLDSLWDSDGPDPTQRNSTCLKRKPFGSNEARIVGFEVFTAVTMKNGVFLDVTPCGSCKNRRFGGT
jgi:hypothetical protein